MPASMAIAPFDAHPERLAGGAGRIGRYIAQTEAMALLNMRTAHRAVIGEWTGTRGQRHQARAVGDRPRGGGDLAAVSDADTLYTDGAGAMVSGMVLMHRGMSIAGGTSEIKRNQIGERILGLPRDPLIN